MSLHGLALSDDLECLYEDAAGTLWTAPDGDGFWIVDRLGVVTHHGAGSGTIYAFGRRPGTTDVWATRVAPGSELSEIIVFPGGNPNAHRDDAG